jgi:PAS domain S-box-containing protein
MGYVTNAVVWPIAFLLLAIAVWGQPANARIRTINAQHLNAEKTAGFVLPVLGAVASLAVLVGAAISRADRPAIGIATASLVVVGLRLSLSVREGQTMRSARFRSLIDNLWDLIVVTEADLRIAYATSSSQRVLGCPPADLLDTAVIDLVHPNDHDRFAELVADLSNATDTVSFETRVRHRNGTWRTMAWTATNQLEDPSVRGYVLNGTDVTEARQAAEELAIARDTAVEATRLKSEFLASMSHEIRTPMNAIIGLTELLLDTDLEHEQLEYASGVDTAAAGLLAIINDILDFSKIEAGKLELEVINFEPALVLEDVAALLGETAQRKGLELLAHALPGLPVAVRGDPTRLRQVLVNLATNAIKFTTHGEVVIRAIPVSDDSHRSVVRFEVTDTGIGIAPEDQQRMFEPFSQADASTTRRFGGTGLGLAIVRQLVELMGGQLGLHSEIDQGSTFWFELPFELDAVGGIDHEPVLPDLGALRAIVVDDNATNRLILRQQLSSWGIQPDEEDNASSALTRMRDRAADHRPYDLAILDLNMPFMDGLDLARALKSDPATATAKLFLLSSSGRVSREVARDADLAGTLAKPVRQSELFNCIIEGLHMDRPVTSAASKATGTVTGRGVVLLVEDNTMNQLVATRMVAKLGYRVDVANNGREAIDAIKVGAYDAVLMDCQMPEMDGYEATRRIRQGELSTDRHLPIVAMTAAAMQGDRDKCLEAGMDDYLTKPITSQAITAILERWISPGPALATREDDGTTAAATETVLDPGRFGILRELDVGDGELLEAIVQEFLQNANELVGALRDAVNEGDPQSVQRASHTLRGASANVGATQLAELASKLEALGRAAALGTAPRLLDQTMAALTQVEAALRHELASTP